MANTKDVYSTYMLAYARQEAIAHGDFERTLASALGCIHAGRDDVFLMPSELAEVLRDMGADQPDDSEALRRELEQAKEAVEQSRARCAELHEQDREARAALDASPDESTPAAARRVVAMVPDMGPTARDEQERDRAAKHLQALVLADGKTDTGGRWLFDAAADEIVRLRGALSAADRLLDKCDDSADRRRVEIDALKDAARRGSAEAREQGAAEMRERAARLALCADENAVRAVDPAVVDHACLDLLAM